MAGPGFLNLFMSEAWYRRMVATALEQGEEFGRGGAGGRALVEFVSANPTGPMTVASARGAAIGDSLSRRARAGRAWEVEREYYINDWGTQVRLFGESIRARARGEEPPEGGYQGDYVAELAAEIDGRRRQGSPTTSRARGSSSMMQRVIATCERFRVRFDRLLLGALALRERRRRAGARRSMRERGHVYEHEGATWLRTTTFGDDKDRVLVRSTGENTYFASDIAYHADKLARGYDLADQRLGRRPPRPHQAHARRVGGAGRRGRRRSSF